MNTAFGKRCLASLLMLAALAPPAVTRAAAAAVPASLLDLCR